MEFKTESQEACYKKVAEWLRQLYGELPRPRADDLPGWTLPIGRRAVNVDVQSMGSEWACVDLYSWPLPSDTRLPQAAYRVMLETNAKYRIGALSLQPGGAALWEHFLVDTGDLSKDLLDQAIRLIGEDAADIGEELLRQFPPA